MGLKDILQESPMFPQVAGSRVLEDAGSGAAVVAGLSVVEVFWVVAAGFWVVEAGRGVVAAMGAPSAGSLVVDGGRAQSGWKVSML